MKNKKNNLNIKDYQVILSKIGKIKNEVRFFSVNENMWQILADDYSNETSVAKGLLVKVEFNSTVNANSFKDSMILVDALTEDCDLIFESSINEDIPNETIKCTMLFSGIE